MRRQLSKPWRVVKWMGVAACVSSAGLWIVSESAGIGYRSSSGWFISLCVGNVTCADLSACANNPWSAPVRLAANGRGFYASDFTVDFDYRTDAKGRLRQPHWCRLDPTQYTRHWLPWANITSPMILRMPIWIPMLLAIMLAVASHRLDRRYPRGHCQFCGYDLTGNISGVCSECGAPTR